MNPAMYIFINSSLNMSPGKIAAQAGHAAVEAYRLCSPPPNIASPKADHQRALLAAWYEGGHYKKLVMDGGNSVQMFSIYHYLTERGFDSKLIIDEGRTEDTYFVPTALGVTVVDKDDPHTAASFASFKTLRAPGPPQPSKPYRGKSPQPSKPYRGKFARVLPGRGGGS